MRFLLIGIGGVYNYGCEAIVRGTDAIIRREYPNAEVVYASRCIDEDRPRLDGADVEFLDRGRWKKYSLKNVARKLLSKVRVRWTPLHDSPCLLNGVDAVLSIGGDLYTLGANGTYSMALPKFGDVAESRGVPYILWGASVGPFTENPAAERAYAKHLKRSRLIAARETATVDYLSSLGIRDQVVACADPAYVVASEIIADRNRPRERLTIGVNLSPLSIRYTGFSDEDAIRAQARTIEGLIRGLDARIVLIPHVVSGDDVGDCDLQYLRRMAQSISAKYRESVRLLESDPGFVGAKRELIQCDLVIAARMHCAINALAAHVPTILVGYSRKAFGMCQYVYNSDEWVIPISEFSTEGVVEAKIRAMRDRESPVRDFLDRRIPEIQQAAYRPMQRLKDLLDGREFRQK